MDVSISCGSSSAARKNDDLELNSISVSSRVLCFNSHHIGCTTDHQAYTQTKKEEVHH